MRVFSLSLWYCTLGSNWDESLQNKFSIFSFTLFMIWSLTVSNKCYRYCRESSVASLKMFPFKNTDGQPLANKQVLSTRSKLDDFDRSWYYCCHQTRISRLKSPACWMTSSLLIKLSCLLDLLDEGFKTSLKYPVRGLHMHQDLAT